MTAPVNRDRLAKVLALLSSPVDGEALAATRMAVKLLSDAGMRPEDLAPAPAIIALRPDPWAVRFDAAMAETAARLRKQFGQPRAAATGDDLTRDLSDYDRAFGLDETPGISR